MSDTSPFQQRAEAMLARVFGGMHHVHGLKKVQPDRYWTCLHQGGAASFDFSILTRLVLGAHEYCLRVEITGGGPNRLKIHVSNRNRSADNSYERHPKIGEAIDKWNKS